MENNKKYVRRSYFPHQYEKEEEFLSRMGREGWHFINLYRGIPTKYEFVKGEPIDYVYQLDFITKEEDTEDYHQLFRDAGWEEMFSWEGLYDTTWYYFRRIREEGTNERIYTDVESKNQLYQKLLQRYAPFFGIIALLEFGVVPDLLKKVLGTDLPSAFSVFSVILLSFFLLVTFFMLYLLVGLLLKSSQFRRLAKSKL